MGDPAKDVIHKYTFMDQVSDQPVEIMNKGTHSHSDFGEHADSLYLQVSFPLETLCPVYMSIILTDLSFLDGHSGLAICCNNCNILVSSHQGCLLAFHFRAPSFPWLSVRHILWQPSPTTWSQRCWHFCPIPFPPAFMNSMSTRPLREA